MGYRLGSMFFLATLVALRIMSLEAEEATLTATAKTQGESAEAAAMGVAAWLALTSTLPPGL